jgi:hydrogenase nickel incorporation protein HypA/HybF
MHEMGIAMQIVKIATEAIPEDAGNHPVVRVNLKVGKMTAVVPDSLRFCFEIVTKDTPLSGATLVIEEIQVIATCCDCGHHWTITGPAFVCPECNSGQLQIVSGKELDVESIELAD